MAKYNQSEKTEGKIESENQPHKILTTAPAPVEFNKMYRNEQIIEDHLFKCNVASMMKNISYLKFQPRFEHHEHSHFYHASTKRGTKNFDTSFVGGHFHQIKIVGKDADGYPVAECSNALTKVMRSTRSGASRTEVVPVTYYDGNLEQTKIDDHTHTVTYKGTDLISENKLAEIRMQDALRYQRMQGGQDHAPTVLGGLEITDISKTDSGNE